MATLALGAALLVPLTFSDPNGVDPYVVRLSATSLLLLGATFVTPRLARGRAVLLAIASVTTTFTLFSAGPQILVDLFRSGAGGGDAQVFWASLAQLVLTGAIAGLTMVALPRSLRPSLRVRHFGGAATAISLGGVGLLLVVGYALPASLLGRYGLQPVQLGRDLPWLGPASVMQAVSQELQFRGLLMGGLERVMSARWANAAQAVFFGLTHLAVNYQGPVAPFVPVTIAVGLVLGWMVQRSASIWPAVIVHAVADIAITFLVMSGLYGY